MRPISEILFRHKAFFGICVATLLVSFAVASAAISARDIWMGYTPEQKELAIAGFTDCYRSASSSEKAFARTNMAAAARIIDETSGKTDEPPFATVILRSIRKAPTVKPDAHGEHWEGPTGFHSGLWWRGINNPDRRAYVQGAFWCAQVLGVDTISAPKEEVEQAVTKLNDWYVISDEDWKDPRSNARVDISVISALQKIEILHISKTPAKR